MIYVYTIVTKPLTTDRLSQERCPSCGQQGGVEVTLYMRYITMIVPFFGMGRPTGVECTLCGHQIKNWRAGVFARAKWSPAVAEALKSIRANYKSTWWQRLYPWTFSIVFGTVIAGALIAKPFIAASRDKVTAGNNALLDHPQVGDIYKADLFAMASGEQESSKSALVKVVDVTPDTLVLVKGRQMLQFGFVDDDWKDVSHADDAFGSERYTVDLNEFLHGREAHQFYAPSAGASFGHGDLLGRVKSDNSGQLHVVERP